MNESMSQREEAIFQLAIDAGQLLKTLGQARTRLANGLIEDIAEIPRYRALVGNIVERTEKFPEVNSAAGLRNYAVQVLAQLETETLRYLN